MIDLKSSYLPEKCSKPKEISNVATISPSSTEIGVGLKYTIKCGPNFVPKNAELLCKVDGTLSATAECVPGTCSKPTLTDNVESISPDSVKAGEKFTVKCKPNFVPEELACQTDGTTSSVNHPPKCNEKGELSPSTSKSSKLKPERMPRQLYLALLMLLVQHFSRSHSFTFTY